MLTIIWGLSVNKPLKVNNAEYFLNEEILFFNYKVCKRKYTYSADEIANYKDFNFQHVKCMGESNCGARSQISQQINMIKHIFHSLKLKNI